MAKTYRDRAERASKPRNPIVQAMIRAGKRSVAHGQSKKAARRAAKVDLQRYQEEY